MNGYEDCRTCEGRGTLDIRGYWGCLTAYRYVEGVGR